MQFTTWEYYFIEFSHERRTLTVAQGNVGMAAFGYNLLHKHVFQSHTGSIWYEILGEQPSWGPQKNLMVDKELKGLESVTSVEHVVDSTLS